MLVKGPQETVTTDDMGDIVHTYTPPINGGLVEIRYERDVTSPYDGGSTITVENLESGEVILDAVTGDADAIFAPAKQLQDPDAADLQQRDFFRLADEHLRITVESGGDTKIGRFTAVWEE